LLSEGLNRVQKLIRMRTRPKVLHAVNWEQAQQIHDRYASNLFAVISEVGFCVDGVHDPEAGIRFARRIRAERGDLPVLLQSGESAQLQRARQVATVTVDRRSPRLLGEIRRFLRDHLGFGDFVFILPDGTEVDRAKDIEEFTHKLSSVPDESLRFHASRNHISVWLMARSEFTLARKIKRKTLEDFPSLDAVREFLIAELDTLQRRSRLGVIRDADPGVLDPDSRFQRLGSGSLGGKARGIAFLDQLFTGDTGHGEDAQVSGLPLRIPRSVALTTDAFDEFVEENGLYELLTRDADDQKVRQRFQQGRLPGWVQDSLRAVTERLRYPLAVRSSSLLEDSLMFPFAGIYTTVMLPNSDEDDDVRLRELELAVKHVYASTYCENARAYIANTSRSIEEEKMGVLIQQLVGQRFDSRFYPHFAGVARSHNFYPVSPQRPEDGVAQLVLGLGGMVVEGGNTLRFSPRHPRQFPGFGSPKQMLRASQSYFYALDLSQRLDPARPGLEDNPRRYPLEVAAQDGTIKAVGSVYDAANDRIVEDPSREGPWLITFKNLLAHEAIPLAEALTALLDLTESALGTHVEVELACDMGDWGRRLPRSRPQEGRRVPTLYLLQVRPALVHEFAEELKVDRVPERRVICRSDSALGHGRFEDLRDLVYVRRDTFDPAQSPRIAEDIGVINAALKEANRGYVLFGPGRWGSSDPWLGIPVQWSQIAGARIIVEASPQGYNVDPSQGAHFFHNITALGIGYLTVPPGSTRAAPAAEGFVNWDWLDAQPAETETDYLRHVRLDRPLLAVLDGRDSRGVLARPPRRPPSPTSGSPASPGSAGSAGSPETS
jgi:hypothetical protein